MKLNRSVFLILAASQLLSAANQILLKNSKFNLREPIVQIKYAEGEVVDVKWIEQRLDNFDPQNEQFWQMRYMENNFFLQDRGPIFIFVGGETEIVQGWLLGGHMRDMARALNGTMFYTEHRYYGKSRPTSDITTDNLKYLTVDQALADLAHFISHVKATIPQLQDSQVILVGASYAASMVT